MSTRIWLSVAATKSLVTGNQKLNKIVHTLEGVEVETDEKSGEMYINIWADPTSPAASMPRIARKYVRRVSFTDRYYEGFRTDGLYRYKGATARVDTVENVIHSAQNDHTTEERYQNISISAGSIKTLREIYSKVRTGELKPVEDWGASRYDIAARDCQSVEQINLFDEASAEN